MSKRQNSQQVGKSSAAALSAAVQKLRSSPAYSSARTAAAQALSKHEQSALRSQRITDQDLSVRINER
jgi:hypothetical protein